MSAKKNPDGTGPVISGPPRAQVLAPVTKVVTYRATAPRHHDQANPGKPRGHPPHGACNDSLSLDILLTGPDLPSPAPRLLLDFLRDLCLRDRATSLTILSLDLERRGLFTKSLLKVAYSSKSCCTLSCSLATVASSFEILFSVVETLIEVDDSLFKI